MYTKSSQQMAEVVTEEVKEDNGPETHHATEAEVLPTEALHDHDGPHQETIELLDVDLINLADAMLGECLVLTL